MIFLSDKIMVESREMINCFSFVKDKDFIDLAAPLDI